MAITKEITRLEKSAVRLSLTVPKDELRSFYDKSLAEITREAQIKGFRKGKAPQSLIIQKFGSALREQITDELISKTTVDVIGAEDFPKNLRPFSYYADPQVEGTPELNLDTDFQFSVLYDIMPDPENLKYEGFEVTADYAEVTDADVERELEAVRERNAIVIDREENAPVQKGDVVTLDYCELDAEGAEKPKTKREDFTFTVGQEANYYRFDADITGLKTNEEKTFEKTFPKDFFNEELAGKPVKLKVKIKNVKEKKLPDLDDELAQDVDDKYNTLEDLKAGVKDRLNSSLEEELHNRKTAELLNTLCGANPFDVPDSMIRTELFMRLAQFAPNREKLAEMVDSDSDFVRRMKPDIEINIRKAIIMNKLADTFAVTVSEEEIEQEIQDCALRVNSPVDDVKKYYQGEKERGELTDVLKTKKLNEILLSKNTIKRGNKVPFQEFVPQNG